MKASQVPTAPSLAPEDVVRKVYSAFNSGDSAAIRAAAEKYFADDVAVYEAESLPWGGTYRGLETVAAMTSGIASPESPIDAARLRIDQMIVGQPDPSGASQVVVAVSFPWRGAQATIPMRALEWFTVRSGKVVEIRVFLWDTAAAIAVLGTRDDDGG